eukprot:TRINITY_DN13228_c0_g1_i1.p1 TRINITY_DN13228_c0_g1~~TRINITY_DN13228_c0_g1_i1.p1  ORF type:complete len:162 (-),score=33.90 TRINITY_DN13228_c0_g1_i1:38-523(-)
MADSAIPTHCFSLVVVRNKESKFLVVQERTGKWYLPAGRVEFKESFETAAIRETKEEAGIDVVLDGILRVEYSPAKYSGTGVFVTKMRMIYLAHPVDENMSLKSEPDKESLQAKWETLENLKSYNLRAKEVFQIFEWAASSPPIYPLSLMCKEGTSYNLES